MTPSNTSSIIQVKGFGDVKIKAIQFRVVCTNCSVAETQVYGDYELKSKLKISSLLPDTIYAIKILPVISANGNLYLKSPCSNVFFKTKDGGIFNDESKFAIRIL